MKDRIQYICLFICLIFSGIISAQNPVAKFPSYEEVITHFKANYSEEPNYWHKLARRKNRLVYFADGLYHAEEKT